MMRRHIGWVLAVLLAPALARGADGGDAAQTLVAEAIKAHRGEDALAKLRTVERKSTGQLLVAGKEVPFTEVHTAQWPGHWRRETEMRSGGQKLRVLVVVNRDRGWQSTGGAVIDLGAQRLKELREDGYAQWL